MTQQEDVIRRAGTLEKNLREILTKAPTKRFCMYVGGGSTNENLHNLVMMLDWTQMHLQTLLLDGGGRRPRHDSWEAWNKTHKIKLGQIGPHALILKDETVEQNLARIKEWCDFFLGWVSPMGQIAGAGEEC